jgi:hypothetical protein
MSLGVASYGPSLSRDEIFLIDNALAGESQPQWNFYFSRVRFTTTVSATPFVYTVGLQTVVAFNYGVGGSAVTAGLPLNATPADTSLQNAGQTINSEYVLIRGVSIFLEAQSDPVLAKALSQVTAVTAAVGPTKYQLGTPDMSPGWGGITGISESNIVNPNLYEQFAKGIGGMSNGAPIAGNTVRLPRAIVWMPPGAGNAANFTVSLQNFATVQQLSNEVSADRAAGAAGTTYNGAPSAWTHPAATSVFVDYLVCLEHVPFYLT